jgi:phospholipase/carboxylesterase
MMNAPDLPQRPGPRPQTTSPTREHPFPHQQLDQQAPEHLQEELFQRASRLPGVRVGRSLVSLPESRAFHLEPEAAGGPVAAFQRGTEFAHIHTDNDNSLHLTLPPDLYAEVLDKGWGEPHPVSGTMMLFGPRDDHELEVAWQILQASWRWAHTGHTPSDQG